MTGKSNEGDPMGLIWAIILIPAVAGSTFVVAPMLVGEMISGLGFSSAQGGYVMSAEFGGMMIATLPSFFWIGRFRTVTVVQGALALSALGHLFTVLLTSLQAGFLPLVVLRFCSGIPNGCLLILCFSAISNMRKVERGFALHSLGQISLGAAGVFALPYLFSVSGLYAVYIIFCLMVLSVMPWARHFPQIRIPDKTRLIRSAGKSHWVLGALSLLSLLLFYASLVGIWTYTERIGIAAGIDVKTIGTILAVTTVFGFIGAAAASLLASRASLLLMTIAGMVVISLSVFLFKGSHTLTSFTVTICVVKFAWMFSFPFMLSTITRIDHSKRLVILSFLAIGLGQTIGPALAAARLGNTMDYNRVVESSIWLIIACSLLVVLVAFRSRERETETKSFGSTLPSETI